MIGENIILAVQVTGYYASPPSWFKRILGKLFNLPLSIETTWRSPIVRLTNDDRAVFVVPRTMIMLDAIAYYQDGTSSRSPILPEFLTVHPEDVFQLDVSEECTYDD